MSRKDYVLIAEAIKTARATATSTRSVDAVTSKICDALAADNPRFDPVKFLRAAGWNYNSGR